MDASKSACLIALMAKEQKFLVATGMRNEGPFIVEWVCWYRMLGFDILIATNDCTDHSPALLDAFADAGWVTHVRHKPHDGQPPQRSTLRKVIKHPMTAAADWVMHCDTDEFLVLHQDDTIGDLMGPPPYDFQAMVFNWKCFGQGSWERYEDGLVHQQFQRCGMGHLMFNRSIKTMLRKPQEYSRLGAHFPHGFQGDWQAPDNRVVTPNRVVLPQFQEAENRAIRFIEQDQIDHSVAQMNHYILRSKESYAYKKGSPAAGNLKDRYTDAFFERHNRNGMRDTTALRFKDRFAQMHAEAMALPEVQRLHHVCCADYVADMAVKRGDDPTADPRFQHHVAVAGRSAKNTSN